MDSLRRLGCHGEAQVKIFIVLASAVDDHQWGIVAVFSTMEKAEEFIRDNPDEFEYESMIDALVMDELPVSRR